MSERKINLKAGKAIKLHNNTGHDVTFRIATMMGTEVEGRVMIGERMRIKNGGDIRHITIDIHDDQAMPDIS